MTPAARVETGVHGRQEETMDVFGVLKSTSAQSFHLLQQGSQSSAMDLIAGLLLPSSGWFWVTGRAGKTDKFRLWPEGTSGMWLILLLPAGAQMLHNAALFMENASHLLWENTVTERPQCPDSPSISLLTVTGWSSNTKVFKIFKDFAHRHHHHLPSKEA